ncbi:MAG: aminoacyl-tRNA hydrolase [Candidatus Microsaccharimonas sp.]
MKLIFAQGNPGSRYARTRHNVGFQVLDALAGQEASQWRTETKFNADIAEFNKSGEKVLLVKPGSFYNETGQVARALVDFYKLDPARDVLVIHDELALPFGTIRIRDKGSDAGNNGIKSLNAHLGGDYGRIRVGIWNELRDRMNDADFVLAAFTSEEQKNLDEAIIPQLLQILETFPSGALEAHSIKIDT